AVPRGGGRHEGKHHIGSRTGSIELRSSRGWLCEGEGCKSSDQSADEQLLRSIAGGCGKGRRRSWPNPWPKWSGLSLVGMRGGTLRRGRWNEKCVPRAARTYGYRVASDCSAHARRISRYRVWLRGLSVVCDCLLRACAAYGD